MCARWGGEGSGPLLSPQASHLKGYSDWGHWRHCISGVSLLPPALLWVFRLTVRLVTVSLWVCFTAGQRCLAVTLRVRV